MHMHLLIRAPVSTDFESVFDLKCRDWSGANECPSCRSPKSLQNEPKLAIVAVHLTENEPLEVEKKE